MVGAERRMIFGALLVFFAVLYVWRITGVAPVDPITDHLSNFYLSGAALTVAATPKGFVDVAHRRRVLVVAAVLVALNLFLEIVAGIAGIDDELNRALGDVNTSDTVDGLAGIGAIALVVALLPRQRPASTLDVEVP